MRISITLIVVIVQLISCQACGRKTNDKDFSVDPKAREVVNNFYEWYINDAYKKTFGYYQVPPFKKVSDRVYIFDESELIKRLDKIIFFSKRYKKQLVNKLSLCNQEMSKEIWDYEPEPQFNIDKCNYLWFDNWVGGQGENISGFKIVEEIRHESDIEFLVEILIDKAVFVKSRVIVVNEDNSFKIDDIRLVWN